jgi:hypothetical protein
VTEIENLRARLLLPDAGNYFVPVFTSGIAIERSLDG